MAKRDKREQVIRRNPRTVRFADLHTVLESRGFTATPGKGDHWNFRHPLFRGVVTVDLGQPYVKAVYVRQAITAIYTVEAMLVVQDHADRNED